MNPLYTHQFLDHLDIAGLSEHWLHSYESHQLHNFHSDFKFVSASTPAEEESLFCRPRYLRGSGGVAIAWRKYLDKFIRKLDTSASHRVVGIQLQSQPRPVCFFSVYLPSRSGCTDVFRESLDYLDSLINLYGIDNDIVVLGNFNADLGLHGGPMATTSSNEQGRILHRYLHDWNFFSVHLHLNQSRFYYLRK